VSQENVEIARQALEAAYRRPKPDFATINALFHPEHELVSHIDALERGSHRGAHGYRDWLQHTEETMPWESSVEDARAIDADRVLAITPTRSRGTLSGVTLEQRLACIATVREGKITRTEVYGSPEEALKAVGLGE
jgi:ketosteroid isomerase-like protein